jgi:hypothetical protein
LAPVTVAVEVEVVRAPGRCLGVNDASRAATADRCGGDAAFAAGGI